MQKYKLAGGEALARAAEKRYAAVSSEYHFEPMNLVDEKGRAVGLVKAGDGVIFCCRRGERETELTDAFTDPSFKGFERKRLDPLDFVILTMYSEKYTYLPIAFAPARVKNTLAEVIAANGLSQMHLAESEKYAHVTFFFNGGVETVFEGEDRVLIPSPKVATYDLQPEMSADAVCEECVRRIESGKYDVIILNFANCDMVGHTGVFDAAVKAVETVDVCVGRVVDATLRMSGIAMVTADHGNSECMVQSDGSPMTAHTTNLVPFIVCGAAEELRPGRLADIAPTILDVMGLEKPAEMDGQSLIVK